MGITNHDASKVLLGATASNHKDVTQETGDPSTFKPGLAVSKDSSGLVLGGAAGSFLGVSLGKSLNEDGKCGVVRAGLRVPLKLQDDNVFAYLEAEDLTFTSKLRGVAGNDITIALVDGVSAGEETVEVEGLDIVVNMDDGNSTAQQIADALEASEDAMALIGVEITGTAGTGQDAFAEDNLENGTDAWFVAGVEPGVAVEVDGDTGEAVASDEATGAVFASGPLNAIDPFTGLQDGYAALVDMVGGL